MNEVIAQDSRYPEWIKAWNAKAAEIDKQIINFFTGKKDYEYTPTSAHELDTHVGHWWDEQGLDANTRSQYEKARSDEFFSQRVADRVRRLEEEGKLSRIKSAGGGTT